MQRFPDISESAARNIDRKMMSLANLRTLEELEIRFLEEAETILPGDCLCWNNWELNWSAIIDFRISKPYHTAFENLLDTFDKVVGHHPVITVGKLHESSESVLRLSDFESDRLFRENPLFREVYRHMDSHYQLAYMPCRLEDRQIILTWNRRALDFTDQDRQTLQYMSSRLAMVCRRIEQRQKLEKNWNALCGFVDMRLTAGSVASLGTKDAVLMRSLLKTGRRHEIAVQMGIRRDSLDKQLGSIRERLGLENHLQLLSALAELKSQPYKA
jgi:hypothetical protein